MLGETITTFTGPFASENYEQDILESNTPSQIEIEFGGSQYKPKYFIWHIFISCSLFQIQLNHKIRPKNLNRSINQTKQSIPQICRIGKAALPL